MPFDRPSLSELVSRATSDIQTRIVGASKLLRRSVLRELAKVQAGANHLLYGVLDYIAKQTFITTADEANLIIHGNEWGINRKKANPAVGNTVATGTNGLVILTESELSDADGKIYTVNEDVTIAASSAILSITAQEAGVDGNQEASVILIFSEPIDGVDSNTTIDADGLNGGTDIEDIEVWRARQLARKRNAPHGGAENDYAVWMLEVDGNTRSWVFPLYNGVGTIGLAFVRDGESPITPSEAELAATRAYIIEHEDPITGEIVGAPVTANPGIFMIALTELAIDLTIGIFPNTAFVRNAVSAIIDDAWVKYGGPGVTVQLSKLQQDIGRASGLSYFRIVIPAADITAQQTEVHVPGVYTYQDY